MKTSISNKQLKKILKFVSLEELEFQEEHWEEVPDSYWERVNNWNEFLIDYLKEYPVDHYTLSVILHEIQTQFHHYERKYLSFNDSIPLSHIGATGLLKALKSFDQNFLNIESINIKTKLQKPFSKDHITKNIDDFRTKDSIPETYRITGKEVILQLFELVKMNKHIFENLSKSEEKLFGETYQFIVNNKPKLYIRKRYSPIIYKYLKEHLPNHSHNKLITIGGFLLYAMGIMPITQSDLLDNRKYIDYLRKNFAKFLPSTAEKN